MTDINFEELDPADRIKPINKPPAVEVLREIIKLKSNGETRIQQEELTKFIEDAIKDNKSILVEGPTGAGKSLSYLLPAILSEKKVIVSTATKQLSEQLHDKEMPFIQKSLLKTRPHLTASSYALLKGRDNYYCYLKADKQAELDKKANEQSGAQLDMFAGISDRAKEASREIKLIDEWSEKTRTGDRSEAPVVSDETWRNYSSTSTECPGARICPFGDKCFAEKARAEAGEAQIVITNHAMVASDLNMGATTAESEISQNILGDRELVVFDELHELESYLSNSWSAKVTPKMLSDFMREVKKSKIIQDNVVVTTEESITAMEKALDKVENGLIEEMPLGINEALRTIQKNFMSMSEVFKNKSKNSGVVSNQTREVIASLRKRTDELTEQVTLVLDDSVKTVRWFNVPEEPKFKKRGAPKFERTVSVHAAPLLVGPKLQELLANRDMAMIGASATVRVAGSFDIPLHNLGLDKVDGHETLAVDSPFDYPKQAMIYIPDSSFPEPVGAERKEHTAAAQEKALELIKASGGRALVLTTTTYDAVEMAEFLRTNLKRTKIKILQQGDAPQKQLVQDFTDDETSVLVATMGMWHGLDVQGPSLSLVVITKIPFPPMNDPLFSARQKYAESMGRNGFMDVYVAGANVMLSQGVGRLIRHTGDKGVVALLDRRLLTKPYGKAMMKSLPDMKVFTNLTIVVNALKRLTGQADK
jgi:ATP-dependent DNA helicase DinG